MKKTKFIPGAIFRIAECTEYFGVPQGALVRLLRKNNCANGRSGEGWEVAPLDPDIKVERQPGPAGAPGFFWEQELAYDPFMDAASRVTGGHK